MPTCEDCHVAAVAVAQSAAAVRDLGVVGAVSTAAASALGIAHKRRLFDSPAASSAGAELTEQSAPAVDARLGTSTIT